MDKKIFKEFLKYVSLNVLGQIAYSCYTLADTFFVSASLGANGLTALNLAFPVFCIINGTGLMIGMGGGTRYSLLKSRGENSRTDSVFTNAVYTATSEKEIEELLKIPFSQMQFIPPCSFRFCLCCRGYFCLVPSPGYLGLMILYFYRQIPISVSCCSLLPPF